VSDDHPLPALWLPTTPRLPQAVRITADPVSACRSFGSPGALLPYRAASSTRPRKARAVTSGTSIIGT
jgi:hypothetical protein